MDKDDQEKASVGYQVAVDLWGILVQTRWSRFNAMVVANSVITSVLGFALQSGIRLYVFMILMSTIGRYIYMRFMVFPNVARF